MSFKKITMPSLYNVNKFVILQSMLPADKNKTRAKKSKILGVVTKSVGNYEKHPFFIKKANEAKALLKVVGLPKKLAKAK